MLFFYIQDQILIALSLLNRSEVSSAGCMLSIKAPLTVWALVAQVLQLFTQTHAQGNLLKLYRLC